MFELEISSVLGVTLDVDFKFDFFAFFVDFIWTGLGEGFGESGLGEVLDGDESTTSSIGLSSQSSFSTIGWISSSSGLVSSASGLVSSSIELISATTGTISSSYGGGGGTSLSMNWLVWKIYKSSKLKYEVVIIKENYLYHRTVFLN